MPVIDCRIQVTISVDANPSAVTTDSAGSIATHVAAHKNGREAA